MAAKVSPSACTVRVYVLHCEGVRPPRLALRQVAGFVNARRDFGEGVQHRAVEERDERVAGGWVLAPLIETDRFDDAVFVVQLVIQFRVQVVKIELVVAHRAVGRGFQEQVCVGAEARDEVGEGAADGELWDGVLR